MSSEAGRELAETRLEIMVEAALSGHDLTAFLPVGTESGGFQAKCRRCGRSVWLSERGLVYSLLEEECAGRESESGEGAASDK